MAQTAPPPPGDSIPRPLPRGGRPLSARNTRPRFQSADALWMALLAAVSAAVILARGGVHATAIYSAVVGAGTVALTYLLGWRASGRAAGVIAGLVLATSPTVAPPSFALLRAESFALLSVAALFAFVAGSSLAALALTIGATALQPEGLLLGLLLLTLSLAQHRRRAAWGAALFLLSVAIAGYALLHGAYGSFSINSWGWHPALLRWLVAPATAFLTWFLLPFCGEMGEAQRRARWLPVLLWAALLLVWQTVAPANPSDALAPFLPLWAVLVGAGLARLLPALTGDIPMPTTRYVIATVAVLSLVALHARPERRPSAPPPIVVPAPAPAPPAALPLPSPPPVAVAPPVATFPVTPRPALHPAKKPAPKPKPIHAVVQKSVKPAVPLYMVKNGRLVRRSKWAIQWDLTHPR